MSASESEGDALLLSELRHRFGNFVQLILGIVRLKLRHVVGDEAREHLTAVADTIATLFDLQQRLMTMDGDAFPAYLRDAADGWRKLGALQGIAVEVQAESGLAIPDQTAEALALIANELVTNCFEHGYPDGRAGRIALSFGREGDGQLALRVTDDGDGADTASLDGSSSLGLGLVRTLAARLNGSFELIPGAIGGLVAGVTFPAPHVAAPAMGSPAGIISAG